MMEMELELAVRRLAGELGLLVYHTRDSRRADPGFPDLVIVGRALMFRELKTDQGRVAQAQIRWLHALEGAGVDAAIWRPADLAAGRVEEELRALVGRASKARGNQPGPAKTISPEGYS